MAGPAPTSLPNHKDRSAGPVHSGGWLFRSRAAVSRLPRKRAERVDITACEFLPQVENLLATQTVHVHWFAFLQVLERHQARGKDTDAPTRA